MKCYLLLILLLPFWLSAQNVIDVPKTNSPIVLDGILNEAGWNT